MRRGLPGSLGGSVGTIVVDDKDVQRVDTTLPQKRRDRPADHVCFIAGWNDHCNHDVSRSACRKAFDVVMQTMLNERAVPKARNELHYCRNELLSVQAMVMTARRERNLRPLLLALALLFATATVVYSVAWMYYVRLSSLPVEVGMDTDPSSPGMVVTKVWKDAPAERAGLRPKDMIIAIDGRTVAAPALCNQVLFRVWYASHPGQPVRLTIQRPGEAQPLVITPVFRAAVGSGDMQSLARRGAVEVLGFYPLLFLVVGLTVLFLRLEDSNAWLLALMFAGFITEADVAAGFALAPDALLHFLYAYAALMKSLLPALFYFFF